MDMYEEGGMSRETKNALAESIDHWERMVGGDEHEGEAPFSEDCALCKMFLRNTPRCDGCPVSEFENAKHCTGGDNPYQKALKAFYNWSDNPAAWKAAASEMADYLQIVYEEMK